MRRRITRVAIVLWNRSSVQRRAIKVRLLLLAVGSWQYSIPKFLEAKEDVPQGAVMCEELDLARTIKENIVICDSINIRLVLYKS
jgi:hypothetical protein